MRGTFREGLKKSHNFNDDKPTIGRQLNSVYFNNRVFRRGDAVLQVYGFIIVMLGSIMSGYGDMIYEYLKAMCCKP